MPHYMIYDINNGMHNECYANLEQATSRAKMLMTAATNRKKLLILEVITILESSVTQRELPPTHIETLTNFNFIRG